MGSETGMASIKLARSAHLAQRIRPFNAFIKEFDVEKCAETCYDEHCTLQGMTVAVKDCFSTESAGTTCGSTMLQSYQPPYTATVVQRLINHGCIMVGKTNLDEFSMGSSSTFNATGPVKNPWTLRFADSAASLEQDWILAGGSSGGSAVAVACQVAQMYGLIPLVNSLDVPAFITRNVHLAALALDATAGLDAKDSTSVERNEDCYAKSYLEKRLKDIKIGIPKFLTPSVTDEVQKAWNETACCLRDAGCTIVPVSLPHIPMSIVCYHVLGEAEIASNMARYDGIEYGYRSDVDSNAASFDSMLASSRQHGFGDVVRRRILAGNYFLLAKNRDKYYTQALKVRRLIVQDFAAAFNQVDALLTPVTAQPPPWYSQYYADDMGYDRERTDDYFTQPANIAGIPALCLPVLPSSEGLPISVQIMCPTLNETLLFALASHLETSFEFEKFKIDDYLLVLDGFK